MPSIASFTIRDAAGKETSFPVYFDSGATATQITDWITGFAPKLDAAIDGMLVKATVTLEATLPGGLKTAPVDSNRVREGADITYQPDTTPYVNTYYVPSFANGGFDGDAVVYTGAYATLIDGLDQAIPPTTGIVATDKYGNVNTAYLRGKRAFRK